MRHNHTMKSQDWYTPAVWVDRVRATLGTIDLDPCSTADVNAVVQARVFYTVTDDGLTQPWEAGTVFCNPPGGRSGSTSLPKLFLEKCESVFASGASVIYLAYNIEHIRWSRKATAIAVPHKRIKFHGAGTSPVTASAFLCYTRQADIAGRFRSIFADDCVVF